MQYCWGVRISGAEYCMGVDRQRVGFFHVNFDIKLKFTYWGGGWKQRCKLSTVDLCLTSLGCENTSTA